MFFRFNTDVNEYITDNRVSEFMSPEIQNEIISILGHSIIRNFVNMINSESRGETMKHSIYSIIMDETSLGIFKSFVLKDPDNNSTMTIRPLCLTRWVIRLPALEAFLEKYGSLLNFMEATKEDIGQPRKTRSEAEIHLDTL